MNREKHVTITSQEEKTGIVKTSVQALDNRVVGRPAEMKKRFVMPIVNNDGLPDVTKVIDRVVGETEAAIDEVARYLVDKVVKGVSAYDVAVANGFKGTEAEWLASLKGADGHSEPAYIEEIKANDARWETIGTNYQVRITKSKHGFSSIHSVKARRLTTDTIGEGYEDMIYDSKVYLSGSVSVIVNKPMDIRVVIKGDR